MKKALFISTLAIATLATAAAFACGGGKGGMRGKVDTNNDGKITLAESQAAAKARFDHLDKNKNGAVTADEIQGRGGTLFERADANKDGKVTLAEMQAKAKDALYRARREQGQRPHRDEMGRHGRGHGKKDHPRS